MATPGQKVVLYTFSKELRTHVIPRTHPRLLPVAERHTASCGSPCLLLLSFR